MSNFNPNSDALESFLEFTATEFPDKSRESDSLADYINEWLWNGRGVYACWGDFQVFLKVIPFFLEAWHHDPTMLDFFGDGNIEPFERRSTSAFGSGNDLHVIFDQDNFTAAVFYWRELGGKEDRVKR